MAKAPAPVSPHAPASRKAGRPPRSRAPDATPQPGATAESTQAGVISNYENEGYTGQFGARPGGIVMCFKCRTEHPARNLHVIALHRLEGSSDPGDEMAIAAIACPACGQKGTLSLSYGVTASVDDRLVLKDLSDRRGRTGIRPGV